MVDASRACLTPTRRPTFLISHVLVLIVAASASGTHPAHRAAPRAPNGPDRLIVEDVHVSYEYGHTITFHARLSTAIPVKAATILIQAASAGVPRSEHVDVVQDGAVDYLYDAALHTLPPFGWIRFWFQATLTDDQTAISEPIAFQYNDNRFPWRTTARDAAIVHWYAGEDAFGAAALEAATQAMTMINEVLPAASADPVEIYIYSNIVDLQTALTLGGEHWTFGHANPYLGVALVAIAPDGSDQLEIGREIPHQLAHVLMARVLGDGYAHQPAWLTEGFASSVEIIQNAEYLRALQIANSSHMLLAFSDLCDSFPADSGRAFLAFAQSQSFVSYLQTAYGSSGLSRLMKSYARGADCELGATEALGVPLSQLDEQWRESVLGQNAVGAAARNLLPFAFLMILILIVPLSSVLNRICRSTKHVR